MIGFENDWREMAANVVRKLFPEKKLEEEGKKKKKSKDSLINIPSVSGALTGAIDSARQKKDEKENENVLGGR